MTKKEKNNNIKENLKPERGVCLMYQLITFQKPFYGRSDQIAEFKKLGGVEKVFTDPRCRSYHVLLKLKDGAGLQTPPKFAGNFVKSNNLISSTRINPWLHDLSEV
ncbi:MAG: hypothetical protein JW816_03810 [Candidatus Buchananbacteria bacterium]|nr:hypothetical protein [Candidatus Buchananbacteria bacterium]